MTLEEAINSLVIWAEERGYHVNFEHGGDNAICRYTKSIEINSKESLQHQFYALLHECGHILIFQQENFWDFKNKKDCGNNIIERTYTVIEEIEAWKRAHKLAERLALPIVQEEWEGEMISAIRKYFKWSLKSN